MFSILEMFLFIKHFLFYKKLTLKRIMFITFPSVLILFKSYKMVHSGLAGLVGYMFGLGLDVWVWVRVSVG